MLKTNTKAPTFNLNSTDGKIYSLKDSMVNMLYFIFIQKMTLQDAQLRLMILINYYLNLKN